MRLTDLFERKDQLTVHNFEDFLRQATGMPPLDVSKLKLDLLIWKQRLRLRIPTSWLWTLLISYKWKEWAVSSLEELNDWDEWRITQAQWCSSSNSYRVATWLEWQRFFWATIWDIAKHKESQVKYITMYPDNKIEWAWHENFNSISLTYTIIRNQLKMRYSEELWLYIVDKSDIQN